MTYIYDILLNFCERYYDFYEWSKSDRILHIKKIPIYIVKTNELKDIIFSNIIFDSSFIKVIENKTEIFGKHDIRKEKYCCLLSDFKKIVGIMLNDNGKIIGRSDLLIDEYSELIDTIALTPHIQINYIVEDRINSICFETKRSIQEKNILTKSLNKLNMKDLQYIYYEFFLNVENNKGLIIDKLLNSCDYYEINSLINKLSERYKKI